MASTIYNACGVLGACLILFGFYRISIGKWTRRSFWYELDNLAGPILLIIYQIHLHAYVTMILNVIWAIVAFRGLASFAERRSHAKRKKLRKH